MLPRKRDCGDVDQAIDQERKETVRRGLDDELGIAPSAPVQHLHEQILRDDPGLLVPDSVRPYSRAELISSRYGQSL